MSALVSVEALRAGVRRARAWARLNPSCDTQGIDPEEWDELVEAALQGGMREEHAIREALRGDIVALLHRCKDLQHEADKPFGRSEFWRKAAHKARDERDAARAVIAEIISTEPGEFEALLCRLREQAAR